MSSVLLLLPSNTNPRSISYSHTQQWLSFWKWSHKSLPDEPGSHCRPGAFHHLTSFPLTPFCHFFSLHNLLSHSFLPFLSSQASLSFLSAISFLLTRNLSPSVFVTSDISLTQAQLWQRLSGILPSLSSKDICLVFPGSDQTPSHPRALLEVLVLPWQLRAVGWGSLSSMEKPPSHHLPFLCSLSHLQPIL